MKNQHPEKRIRQAQDEDLGFFLAVAAAQRAKHEPGYFERCLAEQAAGRRLILVAEFDVGKDAADRALGYIQLNWQPLYPPFRRLDIPEIQDLNVVPDFRRQGIGGALVEACEAAARAAGKSEIGIGVGLYARFGAAQRLYARRGYIPDGAGLCHDDVPVAAGEMWPADDLLTLKLVKSLPRSG